MIFSFRIIITDYRLLLGRLFTFLLLFLWLLCSMVRSLVRLWFYGMWRMRMVGMVNIRMLVMLATYYSLYHRCSSSMDNWSRIYEDNFWETSFNYKNNYDALKQSDFQKIILFINAYLEIWSPSIFPYCCVIDIIDNGVYLCILFEIDENICVVIYTFSRLKNAFHNTS